MEKFHCEEKQTDGKRFTDIRNEMSAFFSTFLFGFIAHGYIFLNNITLHDNVYNFYMGGTYTSGRWMLGKLLRLSQVIYDTNYLHYSTPWYLGFLSLVWIGLSAAIIVRALQIKSRLISMLVGGILVSFPVITSMFGYMFTSGMYSLGTFMGIAGVFLFGGVKTEGWRRFASAVIGILLQACSLGVYQANIGVIAAFTVIIFLKSLDEGEDNGILPILKRILYFMSGTIGYLAIYYTAAIYFVERIGQSLSDYQGINGMGKAGVTEYLSRVPVAYMEFFRPTSEVSSHMYVGGVKRLYVWILAATFLFVGMNLFIGYRRRWRVGIVYALAVLVFPLCANVIYVVCDEGIYSLMMYGEVMIFVFGLYLCSTLKWKWQKIAGHCVTVPVAIIIILYCRYANVCYLKADFVQKAGISYFNRMVARIESAEGYVAGMPVTFIGERPEADPSLFLFHEFEDVHVLPYEFKTEVNSYNWYDFMKSNCGFDPPRGDAALYADNEEILSMPNYPSEGSIQVMDGCVIVKLE